MNWQITALMNEHYFQDELRYLRKAGHAYSERFPKLASHLGRTSTDPDVERLIEAFAFLTARLRAKIDDQLPELTQSVMGLLSPQFLRPIPSFCILQLRPKPGTLSKSLYVPQHCSVRGSRAGIESCSFRTTRDAEVLPLRVTRVQGSSSADLARLSVELQTTNREPLRSIGARRLRLFLGEDEIIAQTLLLWVQRYLTHVSYSADQVCTASPSSVIRAGFAPEDKILPYPPNTFDGYRLLQEYYVFPEKFHFLDIMLPDDLSGGSAASQFTFDMNFSKPFPLEFKPETADLRLNCVPAINLFADTAEPIQLTSRQSDYPVLPVARKEGRAEIFSIDSVCGQGGNGKEVHTYSRFESFEHEFDSVAGHGRTFFKEFRRQEAPGHPIRVRLSFLNDDMRQGRLKEDTISVDITAMNGDIPSAFGLGDVNLPTSSTPAAIAPVNVTRPTRSWQPILDGSLHWQLISALSLNFVSLQDTAALREILASVDFPAKHDRNKERISRQRLDGLENIESASVERLFHGLPVRGTQTILDVCESQFQSEGALILFGNVLNKLMSMFATVNSFHELTIRGTETGEEYSWARKPGMRPLI